MSDEPGPERPIDSMDRTGAPKEAAATTYREMLASHRGRWFDVAEGAALPVVVTGPYDANPGEGWRLTEVGEDFVAFDGGLRGSKRFQIQRVTLCTPPGSLVAAARKEETEAAESGGAELPAASGTHESGAGDAIVSLEDVGARIGGLTLSVLSAIDAVVTAVTATSAAVRRESRSDRGSGQGRGGGGGGDGRGRGGGRGRPGGHGGAHRRGPRTRSDRRASKK